MTTIDGTRAAGTITLPGATLDRLDELGRILGRSPAELVTLAIATYAPAPVTPAPQFATTVDAGDSRPQRPVVETGQGTSRRPAPTILQEVVIHHHPLVHVHLDGGSCVFGDRCGQ